jgi:hypothetical protein
MVTMMALRDYYNNLPLDLDYHQGTKLKVFSWLTLASAYFWLR